MGNQIIKKILEVYKPVFTREDDGCYSVEVPDLPGCCSWGENLEHARAMIEEAAEGWILAALECGFGVPSSRHATRELVH